MLIMIILAAKNQQYHICNKMYRMIKGGAIEEEWQWYKVRRPEELAIRWAYLLLLHTLKISGESNWIQPMNNAHHHQISLYLLLPIVRSFYNRATSSSTYKEILDMFIISFSMLNATVIYATVIILERIFDHHSYG